MIGLTGAHRVGKSTLAEAFAKKFNWKFERTSVTQYIRELGHEPSDKFDFKTRISLQEQVLVKINRFYKGIQGNIVITDRTPIDLLAYTMAEAVGVEVHPEDEKRFENYIRDCFECTNRWFTGILIVQPGIPLVHEDGKAALSPAYIEHLNSLMIGLTCDTRLKAPHFYIPRHRLDIDERINSVDFARKKMDEIALIECSSASAMH